MTQLDPAPPTRSNSPLPLRIITHNIRYAAPSSERLPHELPWCHRLRPLSQQFHFLTRLPFTPAHSIICMQEVLTRQIDDLAREMGREWTGVGVGRDDGGDEGERCVIMFRRRYWRQLYFETVWLNETREVGKKGWDAGSVRIVSCLVLEARRGEVVDEEGGDAWEDANGKRSGKRILIMNTHLDNAGMEARRESAMVLLIVVRRLIKAWDVDFYAIVGDLNSEEDGDAYQILSSTGSGVKNAMFCLPEDGHSQTYGEHYTYTGFDGKGDDDGRLQLIDFVFAGLSGQGGKTHGEDRVKSYAVLSNTKEDSSGSRMSDHRAVCVDLVV